VSRPASSSRIAVAFLFAPAGALVGCDGHPGTLADPPDASERVVRLEVVSGTNQHGRTGRPFPEALAVRAVGDEGPVEGVTVEWEIVQGKGSLSPARTRTDARGRAGVTLVAGTELETIWVEARPPGAPADRSVILSNRVTAYLVVMKGDRYNNTTFTEDLHVSVGDTIEWVNKDMQDTGHREHSATAYQVPRDGQNFDSGMLEFDDRFPWGPRTSGRGEDHCKRHPQPEPMRGAIHVKGPD